MALQKSFGTAYGDAVYTLVAVMRENYAPQRSTEILLHTFRDDAHRNMEGAKPLRDHSIIIAGGLAAGEGDPRARAYAYVRTLPDYADASDV